jgi:capsular polysaccharide transport system permease protein
VSLARITAELRMAEVDLETRTMMMQEALQQLEAARIEANRQVRYLSTGVNPIPPDEATYPRAFENTALAFLVFSGIYLMMSLTASILREQVSG